MKYQCEQFYLKDGDFIRSRFKNMNKKIEHSLLTEKQQIALLRELRLKRGQLCLNNQQYILLMDYVDFYIRGEVENIYVVLAELNSVSEKTVRMRLSSIEKKGLLRKEITVNKRGMIKKMIFNPDPLIKKLEFMINNCSKINGNSKIKHFSEPGADYKKQKEIRDKNWKDEFCSTRWYNDVFSDMYEEASGQPVLTGGREYRSAATYFSRLGQLNPDLGAEAIFIKATEGARYMLDSQLRGGTFGWLHKPPDICMLANQAQAVDYQLRCIEKIYGRDEKYTIQENNGSNVEVLFTKKNKEKENASEQIERVFEELRKIEHRDVRRDFQESLRRGLPGDKS